MGIAESGPVPSRSPALDDRRRERRVALRRSVEILPCADQDAGTFISADLFDCSLNGVAILLRRPLLVDSQFLLRIQLLAETMILLYTVRNCRSDDNQSGFYRIGAEFSAYVVASPLTRRQSIVDALTALNAPT